MDLAIVLLSLALAMALIVMGLAKVQHLPATLQIRDRLQIGPRVWQAMGAVELLAAAGLVLGAFAIWDLAVVSAAAAAGSLSLLFFYQVRAREPLAFLVPAFILILAVLVDIALLLQHNR